MGVGMDWNKGPNDFLFILFVQIMLLDVHKSHTGIGNQTTKNPSRAEQHMASRQEHTSKGEQIDIEREGGRGTQAREQ
jgi:hypothetical protein